MCENTYDMTYSDLNPRFLFSCIQTRKEPTTEHSHDFVELVVILKGCGNFMIEDKVYQVGEGDLILLNPGTRHRSLRSPQEAEYQTECYIGFTDVEIRGCRKGELPLFKDCQRIVRMPEALKKEIFALCREMERESSHCEIGRYFMLKSCLIRMICLIARFQKQEYEQEEKKRYAAQYEFKSINKQYFVKKITEYMEEHYREKISLDQIAANMYLSSYYISKLFKSETGDTPINYLISLRMEKAKELLDTVPDCTIQNVAAAVGYEDAYHFSKLFKKYYGISPLYYKARIPVQE